MKDKLKNRIIRCSIYVLIFFIITSVLLGCSNVRMACTMNESKYIDKKDAKENTPTISDKAKDCVNNPTVIVFKEF